MLCSIIQIFFLRLSFAPRANYCFNLDFDFHPFPHQEWGPACPHEFLGAYRLEYDQSWTPIAAVDKRDKELAIIDKIYTSQQAAIMAGGTTAEILGFSKKPDVAEIEGGEAGAKAEGGSQ